MGTSTASAAVRLGEYGTLAAATGATTAELMHRGGHSSAAAALRYQHATVERDRAIADALARLAAPAAPGHTDAPGAAPHRGTAGSGDRDNRVN